MKPLKHLQSSPLPEIHASVDEIHTRALNAAQDFKRAEAALIEALIAVERERVFVTMGFSSLFSYALSLGLSEAVAYNAITVARKAREIPELRAEIQNGGLSVCKAKKIASVLTTSNQTQWLEKAKTLPSRELEREIARENPKTAVVERAKYVNAERLSLTLGVEDSLMQKLRRAQDQVSQSKNSPASLEETLSELVAFYLKHKDPVEKAKRVVAKQESKKELGRNPTVPIDVRFTRTVRTHRPTNPLPVPARTPIPAAIAHAVRLRDQGRCQAAGCDARRWIDLHHITPVHTGGPNTVENLITLCRTHHHHTHLNLRSQPRTRPHRAAPTDNTVDKSVPQNTVELLGESNR